jgi:predicted nucleic acid-binding Zn ribbon protein
VSESRYEERWRGRGRRRRPRKSAGDPTPIRGLVGGLLKKLGVAGQVERAAVFSEWEDRVGEEIAERARPVRLSEGTLFVEVESSSWMMELQMMKRELMERINAGRESGRIEKLVFVQGGAVDRSRDDVRGRGDDG